MKEIIQCLMLASEHQDHIVCSLNHVESCFNDYNLKSYHGEPVANILGIGQMW